jgi:shikimate kinase
MEITTGFGLKIGGDLVVKQRNIILVGLMGTGKSTVGKALSAKLGWSFVDSDASIEQREQMSISDIFAQKGEPAFRDIEAQVIAELVRDSGQVLATGGGAVLAEANRRVMQENGLVVALTATADTIIARVSEDKNRPLVQGNVAERVQAIMEQRKHAYDFADIKIDTTDVSVEQIVDRILQLEAEGAGA